jgi:hypothetical protein
LALETATFDFHNKQALQQQMQTLAPKMQEAMQAAKDPSEFLKSAPYSEYTAAILRLDPSAGVGIIKNDMTNWINLSKDQNKKANLGTALQITTNGYSKALDQLSNDPKLSFQDATKPIMEELVRSGVNVGDPAVATLLQNTLRPLAAFKTKLDIKEKFGGVGGAQYEYQDPDSGKMLTAEEAQARIGKNLPTVQINTKNKQTSLQNKPKSTSGSALEAFKSLGSQLE